MCSEWATTTPKPMIHEFQGQYEIMEFTQFDYIRPGVMARDHLTRSQIYITISSQLTIQLCPMYPNIYDSHFVFFFLSNELHF